MARSTCRIDVSVKDESNVSFQQISEHFGIIPRKTGALNHNIYHNWKQIVVLIVWEVKENVYRFHFFQKQKIGNILLFHAFWAIARNHHLRLYSPFVVDGHIYSLNLILVMFSGHLTHQNHNAPLCSGFEFSCFTLGFILVVFPEPISSQ